MPERHMLSYGSRLRNKGAATSRHFWNWENCFKVLGICTVTGMEMLTFNPDPDEFLMNEKSFHRPLGKKGIFRKGDNIDI